MSSKQVTFGKLNIITFYEDEVWKEYRRAGTIERVNAARFKQRILDFEQEFRRIMVIKLQKQNDGA